VTTLEELQRELMQAYEKKGQGLAEFSSEIKSLMDIGMSRERALVQLALENKIEIEDIKELEKRGLSKEEAIREFCGKLKRTQELQSAYTSSEVAIRVNPSDAWYLMPILLGFLGGIVAYVYVRDDDLEMAKNLFFVGIIPTFIYIILGWMLFFL
jgi:hypothetical protein